ncbi:FG-GAP-like repeat-containing protein [Desulfococcaceae bacterium HSG9]|nr:FG-GAP-like repeat-containing protein [Desulfococcaceae bacterium HSG9]
MSRYFFFIMTLFCTLQASNIIASVNAPVLKWSYGGCYNTWCQTGWYSSPAVADLDKDGTPEVIAATSSIFVLDGATGNLEWSVKSGRDRSEPDASNIGGRTWPNVIITNVDGDSQLEIVTAHHKGYVSVYTHNGYFQSGWPQRPIEKELYSLVVHDLDGDGTHEIIVGGGGSSKINTWVYEHNGTLRNGWPQLTHDTGWAWRVLNNGIAVSDLDEDGLAEIVVPSDNHYICAYKPDGSQVRAHSMYGDKVWGQVGVWESPVTELQGYGDCNTSREERFRPNFDQGASIISDVNNDGNMEVIVTVGVYDCKTGRPPDKYTGVYIFNADRSRFNSNGFDWRNLPVDTGDPLSENYNVIENNQPNPAVADLDSDGNKEIIYSSFDGRVHAFWLDKTEHHNWPYSVYSASEGVFRFASESVVADLDNDGYAEIIFVSWVQKGSNKNGKLHILNYKGDLLHEVELPASLSSGNDWNGALAAPTLANIDADADLEIVLNTVYSGLAAYDLPGTANAIILWGTGRGVNPDHSIVPPQPPPIPRVVNVSSPTESGSYTIGTVIVINVRFDYLVWVKGIPQLVLRTGAAPGMAYYSSGSGTNILTFLYTVVAGNDITDLDYWSEWALELNDGQIYSNQGIDANLDMPAPGEPGSLGYNMALGILGTVYPVYRFYSPSLLKHLFTIDENEKEHLIANAADVWQFEGIAYYAYLPQQYNAASRSQKNTLMAVHRFYSEALQTHLFTTDENEKTHLLAKAADVWRYEGSAFYVPADSQEGTLPVYRFYSEVLKIHLFTVDENEKKHLIDIAGDIWRYEGIAYYAYP